MGGGRVSSVLREENRNKLYTSSGVGVGGRGVPHFPKRKQLKMLIVYL